VALQQGGPPQTGPHVPLGCSFVFSPGWEGGSRGGAPGLSQAVERDLFDCHLTCFWPAHVPDLYNYAPDWTAKCASAQKDWRKIDLIFPLVAHESPHETRDLSRRGARRAFAIRARRPVRQAIGGGSHSLGRG